MFHDGLETPTGTYQLYIGGDKLFIPGEQVGLGADRCIMGVFKQTDGRQDAWYLGNIILADYYMIFDMTPFTEHSQDFIQIGFAHMNPSGLTYQEYPDIPYKPPQPSPNQPESNDGAISSNSGNKNQASTPEGEEGGSGGGAVAAVIIILLLIALAAALFFFYRKRKLSKEESYPNYSKEEGSDDEARDNNSSRSKKEQIEKLLKDSKEVSSNNINESRTESEAFRTESEASRTES